MQLGLLLLFLLSCAQQPLPPQSPSDADTGAILDYERFYYAGSAKDRCKVRDCTCRVYPRKSEAVSVKEFGESRRTSVFFPEDGSELSPSSKYNITRFLDKYPNSSISLIGYTDGCGSYSHNKQLALRRISAVRKFADGSKFS